MGDRGNIIIMPSGAKPDKYSLESDPEAVILYTHWGGSELVATLHKAIQDLGLREAMDPEVLTEKLVSLGLVKEDTQVLAGSDQVIMVSPREGEIYLDDSDLKHFQKNDWFAWSYNDFLSLPPKSLRMLEDSFYAVRTQAVEEELQTVLFQERQELKAKRDRIRSVVPAYIWTGAITAALIGVTAYNKSRQGQ